MQEKPDKRFMALEISARDFQRRVNEAATDPAQRASVYSRLALIHQVAKAIALEEAERNGFSDARIEIEELTDPPLSDEAITDEPVVIRFSYSG